MYLVTVWSSHLQLDITINIVLLSLNFFCTRLRKLENSLRKNELL